MDIESSKLSWTETEIQKFKEQIEYFKSFKFKPISNENFNEAYKTCYLLLDRMPLVSTKIDVTFLLRGRPNFDDEIFSNEWEISYNSKNTKKIQLGRFNRPEEPMFYASVPDEFEKNHFRLVSAMECHKELFTDDSPQLSQHMTFGAWYIKEEFEVINLCNEEGCLGSNKMLKESTTRFEKELNSLIPAESSELIIGFWKFLSQLASNKLENANDHFITTAFFSAIITYRNTLMNEETNGILYPSSMTENNGLNIVLTPFAVEKFLTLKTAYMAKFARHPNDLKKIDFVLCSEVVNVVDKKFNIVKTPAYLC